MKTDKKLEVENMLMESKIFVADFDELISNMNEIDIKEYKYKIKKLKA